MQHHKAIRRSPKLDESTQANLLCRYTNTTASVQIARIADLPSGYFERVVFPGVCLLFEAPAAAHLEIHTAAFVSAIVSDRIPCARLAFGQENRFAAQSA